jgi:putative oxidoreductase
LGAICAEFFGAIGLLLGLFTRIAAAGIVCVMLVAIARVHLHNGFFMNWTGSQKGEGFEFHLLVVAMGVALVACGGGRWSLDHVIARWLEKGAPAAPRLEAHA